MVEKEILDAFRTLFRGRDDVWGSIQGKSNKEDLKEAHYEAHLNGKTSLGIYPLLDDGNCYFFAIDLDEKDFTKAKNIRKEFTEIGIPAYMALSKGKGYHIYIFAKEEPFIAKTVRELAHKILLKLGYSCEVFPKQDKLEGPLKFGNYINLPCYGNRRLFINNNHEEVTAKLAIPRIQTTTEQDIHTALSMLPEELSQNLTPGKLPPKSARKRTGKSPPCIDGVLKGCSEGQRDEAAFALARHYLDQGYLPDEVMALLINWDQVNNPPINDPHLLETKIRSAQAGYSFGCASIQKGLLSGFCVGEALCGWLKSTQKEKKKLGLIREVTSYEDDLWLYEEIVDGGHPIFLGYNKKSGEIIKASQVMVGEVSYIPIYSQEVIEGAILLPTGAANYGTTSELVNKIKDHIRIYADIPENFLEFTVWYILMSWVYDKQRTVGYLRFDGDTGTGKSRALDVVGGLCYKPMILSGAVTPAPIYRLIKKFRGTLVMDEADFRDSSEKSEVITLLNCGFERGRPVIRCLKDDPDNLQVLPVFGPKVFASRMRFNDIALEARCLTQTMEETDRDDIPPVLGETHKQREMELRNQLLLWRFHTQPLIDPRAMEDIDLGRIEPRLKQTSLPFAVTFKDMPETLDRFKDFLSDYNQELVKERAESYQGRIVYSFFQMAQQHGRDFVTSTLVAEQANNEYQLDLKASKIGSILKSLHMRADKKRAVGKQARFIIWDEHLMRKIRRRYILDNEFSELFDQPYEKVQKDLF